MLEKCGVRAIRLGDGMMLPDLSEVIADLNEQGSNIAHDEPPAADLLEAGEKQDQCPWQEAIAGWTGPMLEVINWRNAERDFATRLARADYNEQRRLTGMMELLRSRGRYRKLSIIPTHWRARLDDLEKTFPNFWEVVDYLKGMYALAEHRDGIVHFDPILLNGQPGCGKTFFAEHLAEFVGAGSHVLRIETAQSNAALSGSADFWSNSKPGSVFSMLVEHDFANACFILDEVEKGTSPQYDPTMSLLSLLEPGTACAFADLSYPWLSLDASKLLWICTSNDADILPAPVIDRLKRFEIGPLTDDETRQLVQRAFRDLVSGLIKDGVSLKMSGAALDQTLSLSPRRVKRILREAVGRALYDGRKTVLPRDIVLDAVDTVDSRLPMGFL